MYLDTYVSSPYLIWVIYLAYFSMHAQCMLVRRTHVVIAKARYDRQNIAPKKTLKDGSKELYLVSTAVLVTQGIGPPLVFVWRHEGTELGLKFLLMLVHLDASIMESYCWHIFSTDPLVVVVVVVPYDLSMLFIPVRLNLVRFSGEVMKLLVSSVLASWLPRRSDIVDMLLLATTLFMSYPVCLGKGVNQVCMWHMDQVLDASRYCELLFIFRHYFSVVLL